MSHPRIEFEPTQKLLTLLRRGFSRISPDDEADDQMIGCGMGFAFTLSQPPLMSDEMAYAPSSG